MERADTGTATVLLKKLKAKSTIPGLASLHELTSLDHAMHAMLGYGLERFMPKARLDLLAWNPELLAEQVGAAPVLHLVADQAGTNGASCGLLERRLRAVGTYDPCHRVWNDCIDGIMAGQQWGDPYAVMPRRVFGHAFWLPQCLLGEAIALSHLCRNAALQPLFALRFLHARHLGAA
jgi:hypothetical protein